jgi:hypothetical protein
MKILLIPIVTLLSLALFLYTITPHYLCVPDDKLITHEALIRNQVTFDRYEKYICGGYTENIIGSRIEGGGFVSATSSVYKIVLSEPIYKEIVPFVWEKSKERTIELTGDAIEHGTFYWD